MWKYLESPLRILLVTALFLLWASPLLPFLAHAAGGSKGGAPTAAPTTITTTTSPTITGGATTQENTTRALGFGGTGLTSTAECLESTSVLFGLIATTHVNKPCVLRKYAAQCKDEACRQKMRCSDPDLLDEGKDALGCPKQKVPEPVLYGK